MSSALGQGVVQNKCYVNGSCYYYFLHAHLYQVLTASSLDRFQSPSAHASWTSCVRTASSACFTPWCVMGLSSVEMDQMRMQHLQDAVSGASHEWGHQG